MCYSLFIRTYLLKKELNFPQTRMESTNIFMTMLHQFYNYLPLLLSFWSCPTSVSLTDASGVSSSTGSLFDAGSKPSAEFATGAGAVYAARSTFMFSADQPVT